jgi:RNA polymerase sigma-70 factor, ECF subfamily
LFLVRGSSFVDRSGLFSTPAPEFDDYEPRSTNYELASSRDKGQMTTDDERNWTQSAVVSVCNDEGPGRANRGDGVKDGTREERQTTLERAAAGDAAAFEAIVREHQSMVFSLACYFLHDPARAEEVAQEAFLRLYQNLDRIESPEHLVQWLRQVTWRCAIDESRRASNKPLVPLEEVAEPAAEDHAGDVLLKHRLQALVASLPPRARMMVILRFQEDLNLAEIAEIMCVPVNTVKSGLSRALGVLREKLTRVVGDVTV